MYRMKTVLLTLRVNGRNGGGRVGAGRQQDLSENSRAHDLELISSHFSDISEVEGSEKSWQR